MWVCLQCVASEQGALHLLDSGNLNFEHDNETVVSKQFPKWLFAQDFCSVNRDLGEGKKPSVLESSSNYMIKLLQSKMESIQQKVPVWCIQALSALCSHCVDVKTHTQVSKARPW